MHAGTAGTEVAHVQTFKGATVEKVRCSIHQRQLCAGCSTAGCPGSHLCRLCLNGGRGLVDDDVAIRVKGDAGGSLHLGRPGGLPPERAVPAPHLQLHAGDRAGICFCRQTS